MQAAGAPAAVAVANGLAAAMGKGDPAYFASALADDPEYIPVLAKYLEAAQFEADKVGRRR
jgi:hypothetical protein